MNGWIFVLRFCSRRSAEVVSVFQYFGCYTVLSLVMSILAKGDKEGCLSGFAAGGHLKRKQKAVEGITGLSNCVIHVQGNCPP